LVKVLSTQSEANYKEFFEYNKNLINKYISAFKERKELLKSKKLLKAYLDHMESGLSEENQDIVDDNDIKLSSLIKTLDFIILKLEENTSYIKENLILMDNYEKLSISKDISETCLKAEVGKYDCEMCFKSFKCTKQKGSGSSSRHKSKDLG
jgi:hypothetical protein